MTSWRKGVASWRIGDTLYLSVPFTWLLGEAEAIAAKHTVGPVIAGGPAVRLCGAPWADETPESAPIEPILMHNHCATYTTRGCPNGCAFCAVPRIEGEFRELADWRPAPVVCDNNLLVATRAHFERVVDSLAMFRHADINQGLDARLFTRWHADQLARLRSIKVRFAFDHPNEERALVSALETARAAGLRDFGVYVLIGFGDTPDDARYRLELVRSLGIWPNPMRYQPLDAVQKDSYVANGWTSKELRRMCRYYSRLRWLDHIPYEDYAPTEQPELDLEALL